MSPNAKHKTSFTTSPSSFPRKPSQPGMHWDPGQGLQPREMTTKLRCVMVPSRGTETGDAASCIFSANTTNQTSKTDRLSFTEHGQVLQGTVIQKHKRIPWWFTTTDHGSPHQRDQDQDRGSDDVLASKRNLKNWKSIWKDKKNAARSGKAASQRQIQKQTSAVHWCHDRPQGLHPHIWKYLDSTRATAQC